MVKRRGAKGPPPLHELEAAAMEEIWRLGEATVRDVLEVLNKGQRQRAYTTIMTIMARLHRKGLLKRKRKGTKDVYTPAMSREDYLNARARYGAEALIKEFGDLALAHFASHVEQLDSGHRRALREAAKAGK